MVQIKDKENGRELGVITEDQLQYLIDQLEEEHPDDKDYYIDGVTLEMLRGRGIDPQLLQFLQTALGERESMEIEWS